MPRRQIALITLLFISASVSATSSYYSDIDIISSDASGISFRLNTAEPMKYAVALPGDSGTMFTRTILVGIPVDAEPFITGASGYQIVSLPSDSGRKYISESNSIASISAVKTIRGRKIAVITLNPFFHDVFYGQIDVSISFQSKLDIVAARPSSQETGKLDDIFGYSILNNSESSAWVTNENRSAVLKTAVNPFTSAPTWYKIGLAGQGLIKITGLNLTAAGAPANISSDSIHLFYGGGMMLPVPNNIPRPTLDEIPLMVFDGGDGILNSNDYIIFYGEAADRWIYPSDSAPRYLENPYTNMNYYWLAISGDFGLPGLRIPSIDGSISGSADTTITSAVHYARVGQNRLLMHDNSTSIADYYSWYWTDQPSFDFFLGLPHALPSTSAEVHIRAKASGLSLFVNNFVAQQSSAGNGEYYFTTDRANSGLNKLSLIMTPNFDSPPFLDFCEVAYSGSLTPSGDELDFTTKDAIDARAEMVMDNQFSTAPMILDLSNPGHPVQINGASVTTSNIRFQYSLGAGKNARFYVCPSSKTAAASSITKTARPALLDNASQVDLFVIAPKEFASSLAEYAAYRSRESGISVAVVSLEDILNQFSFGQYDPTAIRDFLKEAYETLPAPRPSAVLLVGDGSYDFENNLNTATLNYIPPYIHPYDSTASDDNYVYFGNFGLLDSDTSHINDRGYDMMISRWPVRSASELSTVINKIESYEASTNFGPWRATVTFVADDEFGNFNTESFHTRQTEDLQKYHLPAAFRRNKIYLWDYPFDSNRQKPAVNQAIIRAINDGTLMVNYVGHGNPDTWAHEHVFNRNTDLPQLRNAERLALIFTASCSIGFFDDPTRDGMAEDLLRLRDGGAVGTVAATRLVFAGENADFNQQVFDILFGNDSLSICQAIFTAKLLRQYSSGSPRPIRNDRSYEFFGDPFMKLGVPRNAMRFDSRPDSLLALKKNDVSGAIVTKSDGDPVGMDGDLDVFVYDSDIQKSHRVVNNSGQTVDIVNYSLNGPVIYRGTTPVAGGDFQFSFVSPLDIGYGGNGAKISGYAQSTQSDAFGLIDSLPVSPIIASTSDSSGPSVKYSFGERKNFISGDKISPNEDLILDLSDPSGLNLTGGSGHEISLIIDDKMENVINLTAQFEYNPGSYASGQVQYSFSSLAAGEHKFKVKVWDNANNSSVAEFKALVISADQFMITDLLNYPNPMHETTTFSFDLTSAADKVSLEIFTLSGKKIKSYMKESVTGDFHEFCTWDGHDSDGDRVAAGVYIYKVTASSVNSGRVIESFGKVVVVN